MILKKLICVVLAVTISLAGLTACGQSQQNVMNYEQPLQSMVSAMAALDEDAYLACYTNGARDEYKNSADYNDNFTQLLYPQSDGSLRISEAVSSNTELSTNKITELENEYQKAYSTRINISKAEKLQVRIKVFQSLARREANVEIIVVKIENAWYIYGDVITKFDFSLSNSSSDSDESKVLSSETQ